MNRFRTKKKVAKGNDEAAGRASNDSDVPPMPNIKSSKTFRRGVKKAVTTEEPKLELDLSTALPSSDDFRTSLLMSGLSARFSMLREQDDPNSKLGKASDDSVLYPKRQSRLDNLTTFTPNFLSDIAEVASVRSSGQIFRPPFATPGNTDSYHSIEGYGTDDDLGNSGSIMARSKPGEGNNLFGGRQKVYHIPVKATGDGSGKGAGMRGRARYDDDLSQSAFQRFKDRERQQREHDEEQARLSEDAALTTRSSSPPPSGYNRNRETSSTTSSGPITARTSTAATSVDSQATSPNGTSAPPSALDRNTSIVYGQERHVTKTRRLYETGLEKNLHEQQHSAMSRIDSLTREHNMRSQTPPLTLSSPTSVSNLSERFERHELLTKRSQASLRAVSPPPSASCLGAFDFGVKPANSSATQSPFGEPPLSPPMSENDDTLSSNLPIDARDKGKATALGAFQKPAQPYDDMKYSERQMQMKASRETPQKNRPFQHPPPPPPPSAGRNRAESNTTMNSSRSLSASSTQRQPFVPRNRIPELRIPEAKTIGFTPDTQGLHKNSTDMQISEEKQPVNPETSTERPPESQHPANRPSPTPWAEFKQDVPENDAQNPLILLSQPDTRKGSVDVPVDSPTLGPSSGLSGMVRQHLRSDSDASSFFGAPSPKLVGHYPQESAGPWSLDDLTKGETEEEYSPGKPPKNVNDLAAVPLPLLIKSSKVEPVVVSDESTKPPSLAARSLATTNSARPEEIVKSAHEKELLANHVRDGSTATQKETENFANELAQRRRRVQENLKSFADSDTPSSSPVPDMDWTKEVARMKSNPLGILKPKSSRESMVNMQAKSRRMLGLGNATISTAPSPNQSTFDNDMWQREEEEMLQGLSKSPTAPSSTKDFRQARRDARKAPAPAPDRTRRKESESERSESEARDDTRGPRVSEEKDLNKSNSGPKEKELGARVVRKASQESKNSASSSGQSRPSSRAARDRSNSSASTGRSKSRNGVYRDDLAKAMADGLSSSTQASFLDEPAQRMPIRSPTTPIMPSQSSVVLSPMSGPYSKTRSNSRPAPPKLVGGYFDNHSLHPIQTGENINNIGLSPRPSPVTPFSINSTPSLTPNGSGPSTPTIQGFQNGSRVLARKKTINKADISEPTLVSSTSTVDTVNLPPGASLKNGAESAPPVPPINPRRRQTRIQTMVGVFSGHKSSDQVPTMPTLSQYSSVEDHSTFSADEGESKKPRKLRKSSSEGGNLNSRARQLASAQPSPALPGGMF